MNTQTPTQHFVQRIDRSEERRHVHLSCSLFCSKKMKIKNYSNHSKYFLGNFSLGCVFFCWNRSNGTVLKSTLGLFIVYYFILDHQNQLLFSFMQKHYARLFCNRYGKLIEDNLHYLKRVSLDMQLVFFFARIERLLKSSLTDEPCQIAREKWCMNTHNG